jgi:hypothetical protein
MRRQFSMKATSLVVAADQPTIAWEYRSMARAA